MGSITACFIQTISTCLRVRPAAVTLLMAFVALYAELEDNFRGSQEEIKERFRTYLPLVRSIDISGDLPILTVTIADDRGLNVVRELLQAHTYWRIRGFKADLVMLNHQGYLSLYRRKRIGGELRLMPPERIFVTENGRFLLLAAGRAGRSSAP